MKTRLIIWSAGCLALLIVSFGELWAGLPEWLSPAGLQRYGVFHWGVLGLCILWLWLKRKPVLARMQSGRFRLPFVLIGLALLALSLFLPRPEEFLVFLMLLGFLGIFTIVFSEAAIIPAVLLAIYGFTVAFPILMIGWLGEPLAILVTSTVTTITGLLGLPVIAEGLVLQFNSVTGDTIATMVSPACAGYATLGVFIALFALMMLDVRLPWKRVWYVFLFGLVGTWFQNILRIVISVAAGYYWGAPALTAVHYNLAYVIFPLWYALFAYIYLRQAGWRAMPKKASPPPQSPRQ
ncbi:archaeosortase/exosortase family protein [Chloroflexota bacterium]